MPSLLTVFRNFCSDMSNNRQNACLLEMGVYIPGAEFYLSRLITFATFVSGYTFRGWEGGEGKGRELVKRKLTDEERQCLVMVNHRNESS